MNMVRNVAMRPVLLSTVCAVIQTPDLHLASNNVWMSSKLGVCIGGYNKVICDSRIVVARVV